ncbi:hypothetical protein R3P38DRAFT_3142808 [Favolaschia claudopus]|uniref:Uncharacterized protein n=1 Tax=Favolaschia claudopus TaxID=2862362 RepID=A0AAV9Z4B6_9AGAR
MTPQMQCPGCLLSECLNAVEGSGLRYDWAVRLGYSKLSPSSNPHGWTFENTGCRLYRLGLKHLTPHTASHNQSSSGVT